MAGTEDPSLKVVQESKVIRLLFSKYSTKEYTIRYRRRNGKVFYCMHDMINMLTNCIESDNWSNETKHLVEGLYQHHFIYVHQYQQDSSESRGNPYTNLYVNNEGLSFICNRMLPLKQNCQTAVTDHISPHLMTLLAYLAEQPLCRNNEKQPCTCANDSLANIADDSINKDHQQLSIKSEYSSTLSEYLGTDKWLKWQEMRRRVHFNQESDFVMWLLDTADMVLDSRSASDISEGALCEKESPEVPPTDKKSVCMNGNMSSTQQCSPLDLIVKADNKAHTRDSGITSPSSTNRCFTTIKNLNESSVVAKKDDMDNESCGIVKQEYVEDQDKGGDDLEIDMDVESHLTGEDDEINDGGTIEQSVELSESDYKTYSMLSRKQVDEKKFRQQKYWMCVHCNRCFTRKYCLKNHIRTHTGEKPFKCPHCSHRFAIRGNLTYHIQRVHQGIKPFECQVCFQSFSRLTSLRLHKQKRHRLHHPWMCQLCGDSFAESEPFKEHMNHHTGETPYGCNVCGRVFQEKERLRKHSCVIQPDSEGRPLVADDIQRSQEARVIQQSTPAATLRPDFQRRPSKPPHQTAQPPPPRLPPLLPLLPGDADLSIVRASSIVVPRVPLIGAIDD